MPGTRLDRGSTGKSGTWPQSAADRYQQRSSAFGGYSACDLVEDGGCYPRTGMAAHHSLVLRTNLISRTPPPWDNSKAETVLELSRRNSSCKLPPRQRAL